MIQIFIKRKKEKPFEEMMVRVTHVHVFRSEKL